MIDIEEINRLYYDEKMSLRQVASVTGHTGEYIKKRLKHGPRNKKEALAYRSTADYKEKLSVKQLGELNSSAKLTEEKVLAIRQEYEQLLESHMKTQAQYYLASKYGVKRPTISDIVLRKTWKHI